MSASALGRLQWDMGRGSDDVGAELVDLDDTGDSLAPRLYHAYVELTHLGPIADARVGRMYIAQAPEWLRIDGVTLRTRAIAAAHGLTFTAYGGLPVHAYQDERGGDLAAGVAAAARPWANATMRLEYSYFADDNYAPGQQNHIYGARLWQQIGDALTLHTAAHGVDDEARDVAADVTWLSSSLGALVQASYFQLLRDRGRLALPADILQGVLFAETPYWRARVFAEKSIGDHLALAGGTTIRALLDASDSAPLNRGYERYWLGPRAHALLGGRLDVGGSVEYWRSSGSLGGNTVAVGADASYRIDAQLRVRAGTDYASYRYDFFLGEEREASQRYFASVDGRYDALGLRGRIRYELEDTLDGLFHTLWLNAGVSL